MLLSNSAVIFVFIISSTTAKASSVSNLIPKAATASAKAVNPRPVRLPFLPVSANRFQISFSVLLMASGSGSALILAKIRVTASNSRSTKSSIRRCDS